MQFYTWIHSEVLMNSISKLTKIRDNKNYTKKENSIECNLDAASSSNQNCKW